MLGKEENIMKKYTFQFKRNGEKEICEFVANEQIDKISRL
jgi:hypothetical protein